MEIIDFEQLYALDYNLDRLCAMYQRWNEDAVFRMELPRETSALFQLRFCDAEYTFPDGEKLTAPRGSIVFLPEGSRYRVRFYNCMAMEANAALIEFGLKTTDRKPFTVSRDVFIITKAPPPSVTEIFDEAAAEYKRPVVSFASIRAHTYRLLHEFASLSRRKNIFSPKFQPIAEAILYMERDLGGKLTSKQLADMCHVSESCFRRLFREYSGVNPSRYRVKARLEYARKLLRSGTVTLSEASEAAGFEDEAYFSRVFKKYYGIPPGRFMRSL